MIDAIKQILGITGDEAEIASLETQIKDLVAQVNELKQTPVTPVEAPISTPTEPTEPTEPKPITPVTPSPVLSTFYVPETQLTDWLKANPTDPNHDLLQSKIASQPSYIWLNGGESQADVVTRVTNILKLAQGEVVGFSLYAIPGRDAGNFSAGGVSDIPTYMGYVGAIGYAIEQAGNPRVDFVIETDALGLNLADAYTAINGAVDILAKNSNTRSFIGASSWIEASDMAGRLVGAGVARTNGGVAFNVSGRDTNDVVEAYASQVMSAINIPTLHYIIDTSRNGAKVDTSGTNGWSNTPGQKLGLPPQIINQGQLYAYAWVKPPAESDGPTNGGPNAGELWIQGAVNLAE